MYNESDIFFNDGINYISMNLHNEISSLTFQYFLMGLFLGLCFGIGIDNLKRLFEIILDRLEGL